MNPPHTYAEWVQMLDLVKQGGQEEMLLSMMEQGKFEWTPVVSERFLDCLRSTIDARMDQLQRRQKGLIAQAVAERELVAYLLNYRREFGFLNRLVSIPAIREDIRKSLQSMIAECARKAQESLEQSASQDRTGRLIVMVRKTRVDVY